MNSTYKQRILDEVIEKRLRNKGAILVEGAKWCGKTTACEHHAASILYMSDPDRIQQHLQLTEISPKSLLACDAPRLIDEWQIAPKLWDAIRFEVDHVCPFDLGRLCTFSFHDCDKLCQIFIPGCPGIIGVIVN